MESRRTCKTKSNYFTSNHKPNRRIMTAISELPLAQTVSCSINKLYIQVDHSTLMTENQISVGPIRYLWTHFILCKIARYSPFKTCCSSFIFGSCLASCCHKKCTSWMTWHILFRVVGLLCALLIGIVPFLMRVLIFNQFESDEYYARAVSNAKNGKFIYVNYFYVLFFGDIVRLLMWYFGSAMTLVIVYAISPIRFNNFVVNILNDMKHISRLQCLRPFFTNFLLPFEILGLLGIVFGPIYWFFIVPFLILQTIFYCIPTLYLICRLIFYRVPTCYKGLSKICSNLFRRRHKVRAYLATKYISPNINETTEFTPLSTKGKWSNQSRLEYPWYIRSIVGIVAVIFMCTVLHMYAVCFVFVIEVVAITFIGALVNINSTGNYFMFALFMITYILQVFSDVKKRYRQLSTAVFEMIKNHLNNDVERIVALSASEQKNMAFKYFTPEKIDSIVKNRKEAYQLNHTKVQEPNWDEERNKYNTSCTIANNQLHWKIYHLILFLDKNDVPRIPKTLFRKFANLRLHGCPGPVYISILNAVKHLGMMTLFLIFVLAIVRAFQDEVSSSNQLIVTLVGGFIPFILQMMLKPKAPKLDLGSYAFQGVINETISEFYDEFPISDIGFATDADMQSRDSLGEDYNFNKGK